jgi:hypothetical protein
MLFIPVNKVVDPKRTIGKNGGGKAQGVADPHPPPPTHKKVQTPSVSNKLRNF